MTIYRPIKTNRLNQSFGDSKVCVTRLGKVISKYPHTNEGVCPLGTKDLYESLGMKGHSGEDWALYRGEPVYHAGDFIGKAKTEVDKHGGIGVDVQNDKFKIRYWHLQKVAVYDGQTINPGQIIGYGDSTGLSSGDHLHWSLKEVENGRTKNKDNGYYGAIDFRPYFVNEFVVDALGVEAQKIAILKQLVKAYTELIALLKSRR